MPSWTGFSNKTLWDWLSLVLPPLITLLAAVFSAIVIVHTVTAEIQAGRDAANLRAENELSLAMRQAQEEALQAYLGRMRVLLLDPEVNLRALTPSDLVVVAARTDTLSVLRQVNEAQKGLVLQFLSESGLIGRKRNPVEIKCADPDVVGEALASQVVLDLRGADLRQADLSGTGFIGADLSQTILVRADLSGADLNAAALAKAVLSKSNLSDSSLIGADLREACLFRATLLGADLSSTALSGANLTGAEMQGASLRNAGLGAEGALKGAVLEGADLTGVDLTGATVEGVQWGDTICPDGTNSNDNEGSTCLGHLVP